MASTSVRGNYEEGSSRRYLALGVASFAGVMLTIVGIFQVLQGIVAVANDHIFVTGLNYTYKFDVTGWGWAHIIIGAIGIAAGVGILADQTWARVAGIAVAGLSMISNFAFLPYYPLWSLVILAFDAFVIWALCTQIRDGGSRARY